MSDTTPRSKSPGAGDLHVRTGNLRAGIGHEVDKRGMLSVARVGASAKYAAIHEYGGTIRAKNGGYLTFPGRDGGLVRVKQVRIPARPYLRPAIMDHLPDIEKTFAAHMGRQVENLLKPTNVAAAAENIARVMNAAAESSLEQVARKVSNQARVNVTTRE